jgi:hypothetical protein
MLSLRTFDDEIFMPQLIESNNEVGVLWQKETKEGVIYFVGKLHTDEGDVLITTVKLRSTDLKSPSYFIALSKIRNSHLEII